jgi:hypothetical protein
VFEIVEYIEGPVVNAFAILPRVSSAEGAPFTSELTAIMIWTLRFTISVLNRVELDTLTDVRDDMFPYNAFDSDATLVMRSDTAVDWVFDSAVLTDCSEDTDADACVESDVIALLRALEALKIALEIEVFAVNCDVNMLATPADNEFTAEMRALSAVPGSSICTTPKL